MEEKDLTFYGRPLTPFERRLASALDFSRLNRKDATEEAIVSDAIVIGRALMELAEKELRKKENSERQYMIDLEKCPKNAMAKIFYADGTLIAETDDENLFAYIRSEIKEHEIKGCYIEYKGETIRIDSKGNLSNYPDEEFFDATTKSLLKLV